MQIHDTNGRALLIINGGRDQGKIKPRRNQNYRRTDQPWQDWRGYFQKDTGFSKAMHFLSSGARRAAEVVRLVVYLGA